MSEGTSEAVGQENPEVIQHSWQELFEIAVTKDNSLRTEAAWAYSIQKLTVQ